MINFTELDDIEIKATRNGQFLTQIHVAPYFYKYIIGIKGSKKREIETDTGTRIKIPKMGEIGDIVIMGSSERDIRSAKSRINLIVSEMWDRHPVTHFISIPMLSEQIKSSFLLLKSKLLDGPPMRGIEESIFQPAQKLHLTMAIFVLLEDFEVENAIKILKECKSDIIDPLFSKAGPIKIVMQGIEIMNDDPTSVDVLYGKVKLNVPKYNTCFQKMADQIVEYFAGKGIKRRMYDNVKLHVTLMNSRNRKRENEATNHRRRRESFDASFILDKYRNFYFGEAEFTTVHLSVRGTRGDEQYYESAAAISVV